MPKRSFGSGNGFPHRQRRLCGNTFSFKESVMEMFPVMIISGLCLLVSVVVGIYGVHKYN